MKSTGIVYLVGAGPGDVGLLTLRGAELLQRADVIVYDALVNRDLLNLARKDAEIIYAGKRSRDHTIPQLELNQLLVGKAREGKIVVRLKGGDPYIFGRGGEEALELADAKIPFEVVPGISSITAAPNYAGVPLTHRDHASKLTVVTGHEDPTKPESNIDWASVAKTDGTKVIVMGTDQIPAIAKKLVAAGMSADTPIAMVSWGTTGHQQSISGTLGTIEKVAAKAKIHPPTTVIIGEVVKLRDKLNWFEKRSLFGQRIVVTRSRQQASQLTKLLLERSAEVLEIPTIKFAEPTEKQDLADALLELNSYDWLVFTSANGVTAFFDYFFKAFDDLRDLGGARIAAVGPGTAAKLREFHLKIDLMPDEATASKVAEAFQKFQTIENLKVLLMRAEVANRELPQKLSELGAIVDDVACYKTLPETEDRTGAVAKLTETGADWIVFASSSSVENFHARLNLPGLQKKFPKIKFASIGPETSKAIKALGLKPTVEAKGHTIEGLVAALEKNSGGRSSKTP